MEIQYVNVGTNEDTGDGDPIRDAFIKCNHNFELLAERDTAVIHTGSVKAVDGKLLVDGINGWLPYTPAEPSNWVNGIPLNVSEALDEFARFYNSSIDELSEQVQVMDVQIEQQKSFTFPNVFIGYSLYAEKSVVVYHNGVRLVYGSSRDYIVTSHNQIILNDPAWRSIDPGDTITVVSRNFPMSFDYTL